MQAFAFLQHEGWGTTTGQRFNKGEIMKRVDWAHPPILIALIPALALPSVALLVVPEDVQAQGLEEIVVTARRREESLQEVPISIQALSTEELELRGIEAGADLAIQIPNLSMGNSFTQETTLVTLRGIPNVGIYVDGIWQQSLGLFQNRLVDLERVEVMRGPQGTLFGRNTNGGAIQYTTARPGEEFNAKIRGTVGTYDRRDVSLSVDLPLADRLRSKWVVAAMNQDGFLESVAVPGLAHGGRDDTAVRGDILWLPTDRFSARFTANVQETLSTNPRQVRWSTQGFDATNPVLIGRTEHWRQTAYNVAMLNPDYGPFLVADGGFWAGPLPERAGPATFNGVQQFTAFTHDSEFPGGLTGEFQTHSIVPEGQNRYETEQFTATLEWDIGDNLSLRSMTAYREQRTDALSDFMTSEFVFALQDMRYQEWELFSEEIHLEGSTDSGRLSYLVGFYYSDEDVRLRQDRWGMHEFYVPDANGNPVVDTELRDFVRAWGAFNGDGFLANSFGPAYLYDGGRGRETNINGRNTIDLDTTEEQAIFGEIAFDITDRLRLTAGVRFAKNDGEEKTARVSQAFRTFDPPGLTGRAGVEPGDKFAGPVFLVEDDFLTTDVETTPAFSLSYNITDTMMIYGRYAEGFTRGERNFQQQLQQTFELDPEVVENTEIGLRSDWLDNQLRFNFNVYRMIWNGQRVTRQFPTPAGDLILATVSGGKARAQGYEGEVLYAPTDNVQLNLGFSMNDTTYLEVGVNSPLTPGSAWGFAPKYNGNWGIQYDTALAGGGELTIRGDWGYTSSFQMDPALQRQAPSPEQGYTLFNARMRYRPSAGDWTISVFGNNLTDKRYIVGGIDAGQLWGLQFLDIGQRRTAGVSIDLDFGR